MRVNFTHPHKSDHFEADVAPELTGAGAIEELVKNKFLDPPGSAAYALTLARSSSPIGPQATLASVGCQDGDLINVLRTGSGA